MSRHALPLLVLALLLGACEDQDDHSPVAPQLGMLGGDRGAVPPFEVYTQNVYLGGDTGPLFTLDLTNIPAVVAATGAFWTQVEQSATEDRMKAIVGQIEARMPHVVGLQEVLRFVILNGSFQPIGQLDLLALLEAEIAARGLPYTTEVVQAATTATLPLEITNGALSKLLNFTDRVVVLRRTDTALSSEASGQYAAAAPLGPVTLRRGWARVSIDHHGTPHHFVTTHLEVQALAPVHAGQATQLIHQVLAGLSGVTILAGDLNSDAAAVEGDVLWTPTYGRVLDAGFGDVWTLAPGTARGDGFTCCQDPSLRNPNELDQRIDFVLVRSDAAPGHGAGRGLYRIDVIGDEESDRTAGGLWPADHAGLAASVSAVPRG